MVFSSLSFLYFFLPCVIILYFVVNNRKWRNSVLLCASLLFYSWGEPKFLLLMLLATLEAYVGGILMEHCREKGQEKRKTVAYVTTLVLIIANLAVFKYTNFAIHNVNKLLGIRIPNPRIVLPIGISFYTFQILSYVIDLKRGKVALQKNFFLLLLYVSFFPQLIAGPIVRYQTVEEELHHRQETMWDFSEGVKRFIIGLGKKVLLANQLGVITEAVYAGDPVAFGTSMHWLAAIAYTLQIYFDFSGYSDMAIGLGRIFGFHFLENFDYPYISCSVTEYWRRWHISMASFFRDFIYIPLGGSRVSRFRWIFNVTFLWVLCGLWHGAQWNFVLWGFYQAFFLVLEKLWLKARLDKLPRFLGWFYAMTVVTISSVIGSQSGIHEVFHCLRVMFLYQPTDWVSVLSHTTALLTRIPVMPVAMLCMLPISRKLSVGERERERERLPATLCSFILHSSLLVLCIIVLLSSTYNPFIYFRF